MTDLTVQAIVKLQPAAKYQRYKVSTGLWIGVGTDGEKVFFVRYSVSGKQIEYRIPKPFGLKTDAAHISLMDARAKTAELRALGKQGINYEQQLEAEAKATEAQTAQQEAQNATVQDLYDAWFPTTRRKDGGAELKRSFGRDVLPAIGTKPLREVEEGHIKALIQPISDSGTNRKAVVILNNLKQMFKWANGRRPWKLLVDDPTLNLKPEDITQPDYEEVERDRVLSQDEIKALVAKLPAARLVKTTELVIWLTLSCCTRIGETVKAEWQHVDLDKGEWFIPAENTKGKAPEHTVYLSDFTKRQFLALKDITGDSKWCFPNEDGTDHLNTKAPTKQIGDRQASLRDAKPLKNRSKAGDSLVLSSEKWTPHDLRRTGATLMQSLGVEQHVIERIANHAEQNRMQRIYQRFDYAAEQRKAWAKLGALLTELTAPPTQP
ncbi:site-specific integrase [Duganella sp. HH101]|uniref:tyrosine-type recombinase/integrase n=1 Tax=Duganella sp. HH101 TaxID=1781066 RepID=UPI0008750EE7|nr:site-specific integrase [Duganella sp. HH101]OFA04833.1 prophage CP4-57 integrase [Duganella sp. HH101]